MHADRRRATRGSDHVIARTLLGAGALAIVCVLVLAVSAITGMLASSEQTAGKIGARVGLFFYSAASIACWLRIAWEVGAWLRP